MVIMWRFYCGRCNIKYSDEEYIPYCIKCGGGLELLGESPEPVNILGEGSTPLVRDEYRGFEVYFKLEYLNPSGSFKDRGVSYALYMAKELGYTGSVVDSSGNTGLSTALYSGRLGLESYIVVPKAASESKKTLIRRVGGSLIETVTRDEAYVKAVELSSKYYYVAHQTNPFFLYGMKSIGYELVDIARGRDIILPVSSGSLFLGLYRGLDESGVRNYRIICVQAVESASLREYVKVYGSIGGDTSVYADALLVKNPKRIDEIVSIINSIDGGVVLVGDKAIKEATMELHSMGYIVEPSSSVVWAAYKYLVDKGFVRDAILILTGSGLKYISFNNF
ncbi:TPA: pyridoxal-phosphate dependent enzyme [Candidatus Geothermarchaeota archaeon]|nr:pyridoxal-phosphate dependent enzyme [Candidatus Geothermarchaeota archaeon]